MCHIYEIDRNHRQLEQTILADGPIEWRHLHEIPRHVVVV